MLGEHRELGAASKSAAGGEPGLESVLA